MRMNLPGLRPLVREEWPTEPWDGIPDQKFDPLVKPPYYLIPGTNLYIGDVIDKGGFNFNRGSVLKYVFRAGRKDSALEVVDLKKARECLDREIAYLERK